MIKPNLLFILIVFISPFAWGADSLPLYQASKFVRGQMNSVGSDTLSELMTEWVYAFTKLHPGVNIQIQASGSSTAIPALIEGTAKFGPMSREMRASEVAAFESAHGYRPLQFKVATDAVAVYVNDSNPLSILSMPQIDAIFSATRRCGYKEKIRTWKQLGNDQLWSHRTIQAVGRNSASGTYSFFKQNALCSGDFNPRVNELSGSATVVEQVKRSITTIGYSGVGYQVAGTKVVGIDIGSEQAVYPNATSIITGEYPLSRYLYVYVNHNPENPMGKLESSFLQFIFSQQGQGIVQKVGFIPLTASMARSELSNVPVYSALYEE